MAVLPYHFVARQAEGTGRVAIAIGCAQRVGGASIPQLRLVVFVGVVGVGGIRRAVDGVVFIVVVGGHADGAVGQNLGCAVESRVHVVGSSADNTTIDGHSSTLPT